MAHFTGEVVANHQEKAEIESIHPHQTSSRRRSESLDVLRMLRNRFDSGNDVSAQDLLSLSSLAVREIAGMDSHEILDIFHFLLTFRVMGMTDSERRSFGQNMQRLATHLSPKISHNGEMTRNPFRGGRNSTGRELRNTIYHEALRVGQVEAANIFA